MPLTLGYQDDSSNKRDWWEVANRIIDHLNGTDGTGIPPSALSTNQQIGVIPIDIFGARVILSDDFADETIVSTGGSEKASAGVLASDGAIFSLERVNAATDKAARVIFKLNTTGELQLPTVILPPDLDDSSDMTIHLYAGMGGATDTPTIDVQCFFNIGDTECGGVTAALAATAAEKTVTLDADDVAAHPGLLNISLVPGAHTTDAIFIYGAWAEYTKKA